MTVYLYRCGGHGSFELDLPIGTAPERTRCKVCRGDAVRVFTPPLLRRSPAAVTAAIDHAEKSRFEPDVVSAPPRPARRQTPVASMNPALSRLPRP